MSSAQPVVARTLLHNPEVLILNEPENGLDPKARIEIRDLLRQLAARGKTPIVTSHILPVAATSQVEGATNAV